MTISELEKENRYLGRIIKTALDEYQKKTGVLPNVEFETVFALGKEPRVLVQVSTTIC